MRVFVLSTGRSGTNTFERACTHILNYTAGHETNKKMLFQGRVEFPDNHIEIDNRLTFFLGRLDKVYGDDAFYVHLIREREQVANSLNQRWKGRSSIILAYAQAVLMRKDRDMDICRDYVDMVNENIELFLKDKSNKMVVTIDTANEDFPIFWEKIGADGDLQAALAEWSYRYNPSPSKRMRILPKPLRKLWSSLTKRFTGRRGKEPHRVRK